jgi:hypothetical protein
MQSTSKEAEQAIHIHVFKEAAKVAEVEFLQALGTVASEEIQTFSEPVKRESTVTTAKIDEVADAVKKWSKA